jgi:4-hydroxybenzoate polyprenyltransferase
MYEDSEEGEGRRLRAYIELIRPANIVTAWADILAGVAAAGVAQSFIQLVDSAAVGQLPWLLLATTGLYGGGVVFNDVFDAPLDADERPERPIPSGRISRTAAGIWGTILLAGGVFAAALVSWTAAALAVGITICALVYDAYGKHHLVFGPINMGTCRGGNLLLGAAVLPTSIPEIWFIALLPIVYISAITAISRGEVHGGTHRTGWLAVALLVGVLAGLLALGLLDRYAVWTAAPFLLILAGTVLPPFLTAAWSPEPENVRSAVHAGILSLIVLDTVLVAGFSGWLTGLVTLALLPLSIGLGRVFDVT